MFIMDMPPEPPRGMPVLMVQVDNGKRGNVVMQDLTPLPLDKLGISATNIADHQNHFHIDIGRPGIVPLPNNLLAGDSGMAAIADQIEGMYVAAQTIADEAQSNFGFDQGDLELIRK